MKDEDLLDFIFSGGFSLRTDFKRLSGHRSHYRRRYWSCDSWRSDDYRAISSYLRYGLSDHWLSYNRWLWLADNLLYDLGYDRLLVYIGLSIC